MKTTMLRSSPTTLFVLLICTAYFHISSAFIDGAAPKGDFELAPKVSDMKGKVVVGRYAIPKWEISGFIEYMRSEEKQGDMILVVPEGAYAVRLGNEASIKQRLRVTRGMCYSITFCAARTCAQEENLKASMAPEWGVLPMQTLYSSNGWDSYAWAFQAKSDVAEIVIHNPGVKEDPASGHLIDSVAIRALYPPRLSGRNELTQEWEFEGGSYIFSNTSWGVLIPPKIEDDHSPLPGWMVESLKAVKYIDSTHFSIPEGKWAVELMAGKESTIAQEVRTVSGTPYTLTFAIGDANNSCEGSMIVEAFSGRDTVKIPYQSMGKDGDKRAILRFKATSTRTRIMFYSTFYTMRNDSSLCRPVVDDVKVMIARHA